jgi:IclR family acetate operon transcriptional repressor
VTVTQILQSVAQALRIVKLLQTTSALGVAEIARALDSSPSTVHRLLATLREADFVVQVQSGGKYALGPAMRPQTSDVERVIEVGGPHMVALRDRTAETVHLAVVRGTETHFVAAYESPHIMRVTSRIGKSLPSHTTAAGKLLLAYLPESAICELYPDEALPEGAPGSVLTRTALLDELRRVREVEYGRNLAESEVGVAALAVPVRDASGEVICSLTLTGPDSQYNPQHTVELTAREIELLHFLRRTAGLIESELAATAVAPH